ncbi:hypothetical protein ACKUU1_03865 [Mycobacterium seoulense]|uniref:hypothetical protein n=1 Tax=Mycobacterium seoulense TaxID=386911 RepID=UPI003CF98159
MSLINQATGQAQQLAQSGHRTRGDDETAPAEGLEAAGAAPGADGDERAPVEGPAAGVDEEATRRGRVR